MLKAVALIVLSLFSFSVNSTELTPYKKELILSGNHCCYSQKIIDDVYLEYASEMPKYLTHPQLDLDFTFEKADNTQWTIFFALQILDVYTTNEALRYNCVEELNPLLGKSPSLEDIIFLKLILLGPTLYQQWNDIQNKDLYAPNFLMAHVIANNYDVWSTARKNCTRIDK
jgi:hypothetical protein